MKTGIYQSVILAVASTLLVSGCVVRETRYRDGTVATTTSSEVVVESAPPAPIVEVETVSPGPEFVWVGGVWGWHGSRWEWERGHWDRPPHRGAVWVPHRYVYRGGRHVYVRGGWR